MSGREPPPPPPRRPAASRPRWLGTVNDPSPIDVLRGCRLGSIYRRELRDPGPGRSHGCRSVWHQHSRLALRLGVTYTVTLPCHIGSYRVTMLYQRSVTSLSCQGITSRYHVSVSRLMSRYHVSVSHFCILSRYHNSRLGITSLYHLTVSRHVTMPHGVSHQVRHRHVTQRHRQPSPSRPSHGVAGVRWPQPSGAVMGSCRPR